MREGLFIAIEGVEGVGKTTQTELVAKALGASWTKEPGGNPIGRQLREILLHTEYPLQPITEVLLMMADRVENWHSASKNVIEHGGIVVTDRSYWSTYAYQGFGRQLSGGKVAYIDGHTGVPRPDIVILLDLPDAIAISRMRGKDPDRFEREGEEFFARVRHGFERALYDNPETFVRVHGEGAREEVTERIIDAIKGHQEWTNYQWRRREAMPC